jgi:hypothetical protein
LAGKPFLKWSFGILGKRWDDNIGIDPTETVLEDDRWTEQLQDSHRMTYCMLAILWPKICYRKQQSTEPSLTEVHCSAAGTTNTDEASQVRQQTGIDTTSKPYTIPYEGFITAHRAYKDRT